MTNFELLKTLSIEEMAAFLANETCRVGNIPLEYFGQKPMSVLEVAKARLEWLKSEVQV